MRRTPLQESLCQQYGDAVYITGSGLTWNNPVSFTPDDGVDVSSNISDNSYGALDPDILLYGWGYSSIGHSDIDATENKRCFLFGVTIKEPDSSEYVLPDQLSSLAPVLQSMAAHHHHHIPYPETYACGIMYRHLPLAKNQIAQDWHVHRPFCNMIGTKERITSLEIPEQSVKLLPSVCPDMVSNEYFYSNILGSLMQTAPASAPLEMVEKETAYSLTEDLSPDLVEQLGDGDIAQGNSYVFHRAACVPTEFIGRERALLAVSFLPTYKTAEAMGLRF